MGTPKPLILNEPVRGWFVGLIRSVWFAVNSICDLFEYTASLVAWVIIVTFWAVKFFSSRALFINMLPRQSPSPSPKAKTIINAKTFLFLNNKTAGRLNKNNWSGAKEILLAAPNPAKTATQKAIIRVVLRNFIFNYNIPTEYL
jgi:hypothetical protein